MNAFPACTGRRMAGTAARFAHDGLGVDVRFLSDVLADALPPLEGK